MKVRFFAAFLLIVSNNVSADTLIQFENSDKSMPEELSIKNGIVMLKDPQGRGRMIFDTTREQMLMVNDQRKEYIVINEAFIDKMTKAYQQQMDIMMSSLSPEQRKAMQQQIDQAKKAQSVPQISVKKTGEKRKVNGIKCEVNSLSNNNKVIIKTCLASAKDAGMNAKDYSTFRKMSTLSERLSKKSEQLAGPMGQAMQSSNVYSKLEGVPVEFKQLSNGQTSTVTAVKSIKLDAKQFSTAGLKQADPFQRPPSPAK